MRLVNLEGALADSVNVRRHVFRHDVTIPAEEAIFSELRRRGINALDVGTAATGRSALLLDQLGFDVVSIDFNREAVAEFGRSESNKGMALAAADLMALPFDDDSFDSVVIAFHGMDYLTDADHRRAALQEAQRVVRPAGSLVFNSYNPVGLVLDVGALRQRHQWKSRARYLATGGFLRPTLVDGTGLRLKQSTPWATKIEVEGCTDFRLDSAWNRSGKRQSLAVVAATQTEPYYLFHRQG